MSVIHGVREGNGLFNGKDKIRVPKKRENLLLFFLTVKNYSLKMLIYIFFTKSIYIGLTPSINVTMVKKLLPAQELGNS